MSGTGSGVSAQILDFFESGPLLTALSMLSRAACYAADTKRDIWDFAVERADFYHAKVFTGELRWLLAHGYVAHAQEVSQVGETTRKFLPMRSLTIPEKTCFVLTGKGMQLVNQSKLRDRLGSPPTFSGLPTENFANTQQAGHNGHPQQPQIPHWDVIGKELSFASQTVKRLIRQAPNQEVILNAFQEEGWPKRIDDPLSQATENSPRRRLQDTIKALNRKHEVRLLRFRGDGRGRGIVWEKLKSK